MSRPDVGGRRVVVLGLGRSGCAAATLLRRHGAVVTGVDDAEAEVVANRWDRDGLDGTEAFDAVIAGPDWPLRLAEIPEAVVLSPGVPGDHPALADWRARGVSILGELEWATRFLEARAVAVTGTNGKSTTTAWIAHVLAEAGLRSRALGNLGTPLAAEVLNLAADDVAVVECSSFQLETLTTWRPRVGVVLNLAPDHLDRYADVAAYYRAKARLARAVADDGWFVTWTDCPEARSWAHGGDMALFGAADPAAVAWLESDQLMVRHGGRARPLLPLADLRLQSPPNLLNAAATAAACLPFLDDLEALASGLCSFGGLAHRHQLVGHLGAVAFINDSKATNVHAVLSGLRGYPRPVVLIAGGSGKGEDYQPLRDVMAAVRHVVTIGVEGPAIAAALRGAVPTSPAPDLTSAVRLAAELAYPDACVMLSPACASFDMFTGYRQRGEAFRDAVRGLGAEED